MPDLAPGEPGGRPAAGEGVPEVAARRLGSSSFSSGLSVPDFAACLQVGLRPVALVQGFCVMQWGWYGVGSPYVRGVSPFAGGSGWSGYNESWRCPHGYVVGSGDHRVWGQNYEQTWVEAAWAQGFGTAYARLVDEARDAGAHGVVGVVDSVRHLAEQSVTEFHLTGTAVVAEDLDGPPGGPPFTTYLAGQRLVKLVEAGMVPVSIVASMASVRVWASCVTELLTRGQSSVWGQYVGGEIEQLARAHMAARDLAREHVRRLLATDQLFGAQMGTSHREVGEGDEVVECTLKGTRVRRFQEFEPLPAPVPTVTLA